MSEPLQRLLKHITVSKPLQRLPKHITVSEPLQRSPKHITNNAELTGRGCKNSRTTNCQMIAQRVWQTAAQLVFWCPHLCHTMSLLPGRADGQVDKHTHTCIHTNGNETQTNNIERINFHKTAFLWSSLTFFYHQSK